MLTRDGPLAHRHPKPHPRQMPPSPASRGRKSLHGSLPLTHSDSCMHNTCSMIPFPHVSRSHVYPATPIERDSRLRARPPVASLSPPRSSPPKLHLPRLQRLPLPTPATGEQTAAQTPSPPPHSSSADGIRPMASSPIRNQTWPPAGSSSDDALIVWITPDRQLEPGINRCGKVVLLLAYRASARAVETKLHVSRPTLVKWPRRFLEPGVEGLTNQHRGRPPWDVGGAAACPAVGRNPPPTAARHDTLLLPEPRGPHRREQEHPRQRATRPTPTQRQRSY